MGKHLDAQALHEEAWTLATKMDYDGLRALCAPGFELLYNSERHDVDGMIRLLEMWQSGFSEIGLHRHPILTLRDGDDKFCVVYDMVATHDGEFMAPTGETLPATRKEVTARIADVFICQDGMIKSWLTVFNEADVMRQIMPQQAGTGRYGSGYSDTAQPRTEPRS